jgi:hypothetical protein
MAATPRRSTAAAADPDSVVVVVYTRRHFFAGESRPREPGDREAMLLHLARALRGYQIVSIEDDPDARSVPTEQAPAPSPERVRTSSFRYAGELLIPPDTKLIR